MQTFYVGPSHLSATQARPFRGLFKLFNNDPNPQNHEAIHDKTIFIHFSNNSKIPL